MTGINDPEMFKVQVVERDPHGSSESWRFTELESGTVTTVPMEDEQIELRTAVSKPEEALEGSEGLQNLVQGKSSPRVNVKIDLIAQPFVLGLPDI